MGDQRVYIRGRNDLYAYLYTTLSTRVTINGVTGRIVAEKHDPWGEHQHLPSFSKTCDVYFSLGKGGEVNQAKLYENGMMKLDFDWDHAHCNRVNGRVTEVFPQGVVHVQEYEAVKVNGKRKGKPVFSFRRKSNQARLMTDAEIEKYGPLLRHFNPNVKFRP